MTSFPSTAAASASPIWGGYGCGRRCVLRASSSPLPSPGWRTGGLSASPSLPTLSPCVPLKTKARPGWIWGYRPWQHSPQGEKVIGPKPHKALLKRLGRLSRNLLRKKKESANRTKAKAWICKAACQDCQYPAGGLAQAHLTAQAMISPRACQRAESGQHGEEPVILPAFYPTWVSSSFGDNWNIRQKGVVVWCLSLVAGFRPARAVRHGGGSRKHCRWPFASGYARSVEASTTGR